MLARSLPRYLTISKGCVLFMAKKYLVTKEKSAEGIYDALLTLKKHPLQREDCLNKGREYDKNKRFEEYISLYRKIKNAGD